MRAHSTRVLGGVPAGGGADALSQAGAEPRRRRGGCTRLRGDGVADDSARRPSSPASPSFVSPARGVMLGSVGCKTQGCRARLAATADGGSPTKPRATGTSRLSPGVGFATWTDPPGPRNIREMT